VRMIAAIRWAISAVFLLAAYEKFDRIRLRTTRLHPVLLQLRLLKSRAPLVLGMSMVADLTICILLAGSSSLAGPLLGAAALLSYTAVAARVPAASISEGCSCTSLPALEARTKGGLLARNATIFVGLFVVAKWPSEVRLTGLGVVAAVGFFAMLALVSRATSLLIERRWSPGRIDLKDEQTSLRRGTQHARK